MIVTQPPAPLSTSVTVALTAAEKSALSAEAKVKNTSMSALGRQAIVAQLSSTNTSR